MGALEYFLSSDKLNKVNRETKMKSNYEAVNDWCMTDLEDQRSVDTTEREFVLSSSIQDLQKVNKKIAKLRIQQEELTNSIISGFGHNHEGQKTYEYDVWKVEIKTPIVYSLDKKLYESGDVILPKEFNPIKESISYSIDKKLFEKYMSTADKEVVVSLIELIEKNPGKVSVVVKERV